MSDVAERLKAIERGDTVEVSAADGAFTGLAVGVENTFRLPDNDIRSRDRVDVTIESDEAISEFDVDSCVVWVHAVWNRRGELTLAPKLTGFREEQEVGVASVESIKVRNE